MPDGSTPTLIGTVPPQHMYGFESTVLLALFSGCAFTAERPFYPADICAAIGAAPRPRALVSTPIHLRTLLGAGIELPPLDLIVSATAPLEQELAREAEAKIQRPIARDLRIDGNRADRDAPHRRFAHLALVAGRAPQRRAAAQVYAHGGHVEQLTPLCDVVEITGDDEFILHGRTADLVNVAGKRSSFAYLNAQLNAIPGVLDGVFFLREPGSGGLTGVGAAWRRPWSLPDVDAATLIDHLRRAHRSRVLAASAAHGRSAAAQCDRQAAAAGTALLGRSAHAGRDVRDGPAAGRADMYAMHVAALEIAADHPAFAGHFPGHADFARRRLAR